MITFPGSFLNAGYDETDAIGHLFHDKDAILGTKYLETVQHDEHVLFVFVHESEEQRYGYDQFRHVVRVDLPCDEVARIVQHLDGEINPLNRTVALTDDEGNDIAFCRYTHDHVGVGTLLNGKLMVIDLDGDAIFSLVNLLDAYVRAYDDYIANQVDVTKPAHEWRSICEALRTRYDGEIADRIEEQVTGFDRTAPVSVRLRDAWQADYIEDVANVEITADASDWLAVFNDLLRNRHDEIADELMVETGLYPFSRDPYPYGVLPTSPITCSISLGAAATVRHTLNLLALDRHTVLK